MKMICETTNGDRINRIGSGTRLKLEKYVPLKARRYQTSWQPSSATTKPGDRQRNGFLSTEEKGGGTRNLESSVLSNSTAQLILGAIHALWALHGLGSLTKKPKKQHFWPRTPALRRNAIRALGYDDAARALYFGSGVVTDSYPQTRLAAWVKLAEFPSTLEVKTLVKGLLTDPATSQDEWLREAS